jgi:hypothetical protein
MPQSQKRPPRSIIPETAIKTDLQAAVIANLADDPGGNRIAQDVNDEDVDRESRGADLRRGGVGQRGVAWTGVEK